MLLIYMLICYSVNCKTAKRCLTPKNTGALTPRLYFFYREHGLASPEPELFLLLKNNGILVMAAHPHKL